MRNALNEVLRDWYVGDCQAGVDRWNKRVLEAHGMSERIALPSRKFNRKVGVYAGKHFDPWGNALTAEEWERRKDEWLPSPEDKAYLHSIQVDAGLQAGPVRQLHRAAAARHQSAADRLRVRPDGAVSDGWPGDAVADRSSSRRLPTPDADLPPTPDDDLHPHPLRRRRRRRRPELNDPPANTYSYEMMREIDEAVLAARMDAAVHVIVLTGAGEKFFCAGANIGMLKDADPDVQVLLLPARQRDAEPARADAEAGDRRAQRPHASAAGSKWRWPPTSASRGRAPARSACPKSALGVLPGTGGTQRLARLVGKAKAIELMATGALLIVRGGRATLGLVNHVWGEAELNGRTLRATPCSTTRSSSRRRTGRAGPSGTSSARCSRGSR